MSKRIKTASYNHKLVHDLISPLSQLTPIQIYYNFFLDFRLPGGGIVTLEVPSVLAIPRDEPGLVSWLLSPGSCIRLNMGISAVALSSVARFLLALPPSNVHSIELDFLERRTDN